MLAELNRRQMQVGADVVVIYQEAAPSDPQMAETLRNVLAAREREICKPIDALAPRLRWTSRSTRPSTSRWRSPSPSSFTCSSWSGDGATSATRRGWASPW